MRRTLGWFALLAIFLLPGCASTPNFDFLYADEAGQTIARNVDQCLELIGNRSESHNSALPTEIRLLSWNVEKGNHEAWEAEFSRLSELRNLILTQEALLTDNTMSGTSDASFVSLSPGYVREGTVTGVATYSSAEPLVECHLASTEPILRTLKATGIALYDVASNSEDLLVANVHAINFSLGLGEFTRQIQKIEMIVDQHDGPVILGGDFNTWRPKRFERVAEMAHRTQLRAVEFDEDYRTLFLGHVVDYIFVRDLTVKTSRVERTESSDHNALIVEFEL